MPHLYLSQTEKLHHFVIVIRTTWGPAIPGFVTANVVQQLASGPRQAMLKDSKAVIEPSPEDLGMLFHQTDS